MGIGGRHDATNVIPPPAACGVTLLDLDHVRVLGNSLELIAYEKGGIFKPGVSRVLSTPQQPGPWSVLKECAAEAQLTLELVQPLAAGVKLGLPGDHQLTNAALAIELCEAIAPSETQEQRVQILRAVEMTRWPGRCEEVHHSGVRFMVDGAHTPQSMESYVEWVSLRDHDDDMISSIHTGGNRAYSRGAALRGHLLLWCHICYKY